MTEQQTFDIIYNGLKSQGFKQSLGVYNPSGSMQCAYRGDHGLKCAAGHLMDDSEYLKDFEGKTAICLYGKDGEHMFKEHNFKFLARLQRIHDENDIPERMQKSLHKCAKEFELTVPGVAA